MRIFFPVAAWDAALAWAATPAAVMALRNSRRFFIWAPIRSENKLQRNLHDTRAAGAADDSEGRTVHRGTGGAEIGMIEDVEKLPTKLYPQAFDHVEGLEQRVVQVPVAGRAQLRAAGAAERADGVRPE